jgi:hypothetical protein
VNKGLRATSGQVIGWLNSDDTYYPGAIRTVWDFFESHPHVDVVHGEANLIDVYGNVLERYYTEPWDPERLKQLFYICQPAAFFRRRVVGRFGDLDERLQYCLDYEYWLRLATGGAAFAYLPHMLVGSRLYPENKTLGSRPKVVREITAMLRERIGCVHEMWIFTYAHAMLESKGFTHAHPCRFAGALSGVSLYASLRWNRRIPREVLRTTGQWMGGSARALLGRLFRR